MKYKIPVLLLALSMLLTMAACGESGGSALPGSAAEMETFGAESLNGQPEQMAEITGQTETDSQAEAVAGSVQEGQEQAEPQEDLTELAVECAVAAIYHDDLTYDPGDPVYFWRALGYLLGHTGTISDGQVKVPTGDVGPYVAALFGEYTEQYPSLGEENPLVSEAGGVYTVSVLGPFDHSFTMAEIVPEDGGGYSCHAEVSGSAGTAGYTVTLEDYAGEDGRFAYSITGIRAE